MTDPHYRRFRFWERLDHWLIRIGIPRPMRHLVGFWKVLLDEGAYGACDFLAFCFLDEVLPARDRHHPDPEGKP